MSVPIAAPWYAEGLQFTCTQCGNCCSGAPGYVWVNDDEIDAIAKFLNLPRQEFLSKHTRAAVRGRSLLEYADGDCEFLERRDDGTTACSIHPVRPTQCRTWPFWDSNLRSRRSWNASAKDCPGMNQGAHHPLPVIQEAVQVARRQRLDL